MRDGRVREHPLHVALRDRGEVADRERGDREHRDGDRPDLGLLGERGDEDPVHEREPGDLRRRRHERGHRRGRALVDVGRPHVERRRRDLEASPARIIAIPVTNSGSSAPGRLLDRREPELAGRAVDERAAEEQDPRAEASDDEVLEPGLERLAAVRVERAEDVERDREPLEREEHRHQVRRPRRRTPSRPRTRRGARSTRRRGRGARRPPRGARPRARRPRRGARPPRRAGRASSTRR